MGKKICEFCDGQLDETELSGHDCSHTEYSMLYLHEGMKDELMVIVYHEPPKWKKKKYVRSVKQRRAPKSCGEETKKRAD